MTTYCEHCDHCLRDSKPTYTWLCLKHPRIDGAGFVTERWWDDDPPYLKCNRVNGGACPLYEPRRINETE